MCGIAGEVNYQANFLNCDKRPYEQMLKTLTRRGPDQQATYFQEHCALLHARLSVIDIENGKQPMTFNYNKQSFTIVYNGELYNTEDIRKQLLEAGFLFQSHSDTEVLLKSFIHWKEDCVNHLNGIFAFAIWDSSRETLFVARDKMGVKPFFYTIKEGSFIFGSELKALLKHPKVEATITSQSIHDLILTGPGRTPGFGVFKDIAEIKPGECGYMTVTGLKLNSYFHLQDAPHHDTFEQTVEKVRYLVSDAITRQLISDVKLATFLSGGLDSSIISAVAANYLKTQGEQLDTFSVYYKDNEQYFSPTKFQPNSDPYYIDLMTKHIGSKHHQIVLDTPQLVNALYDAVHARDLPGMADVDSSLLLFCKEVKNHCTVALSGECADEIFGGYPWYQDKSIEQASGFPWSQSTAWRYSFLTDDMKEKLDPFAYVDNQYALTIDRADLSHTSSFEDKKHKEMVNLNMDWFMQTLLDRKDRMSMYSGLEVRVPFCDYRIAEYLYTVPWAFKHYQNYEKGLLREAFKDILPHEVAFRKKSPYPKTHNPSYFKAVYSILKEILENPNEPIFEFIDRTQLARLLVVQDETPWYGQLMTIPQTIAYFIQLNYWLKTYHIHIEH